MAYRRQQRPKGKKRPRRYHHGRGAGAVNDVSLRDAQQEFARAESDYAETVARAEKARRETGELREIREQLGRVNPTALSLEIGL